MFEAIEKSSVPVQIVDYYLDAISRGEFKDNDKLPPERALCEMLGVGRSTLREGLRILEMMGVINKRSDGTYIRIQNENLVKEAIAIDFAAGTTNYMELIELRNLLEMESASLAAQNADADELRELQGCCRDMAEHLGDVSEYARYGTEFHIAIARASGNDIMYQIFETIRYVMFDYQKNNMRTEEEVMRSYREHLELLEAIEQRNGPLCREIMARHLEYTQNLYEEKL